MPWEETEDYIRSGHREPSDTCRTKTLSESKGIKAVVCRYGDSWEIQSYLFSKSKGWTVSKAREWFESHRGDAYETFTVNAALNLSSLQVLDAGKTWRVPTVFTKEGVHNGGFKPADEVRRMVENGWMESLPIVSDTHAIVTASDRVTGYCRETHYSPEDKAAKGYSDFIVDRLTTGQRDGLLHGTLRGGSLAFFCKRVNEPGVFNGKPYDEREESIIPEHYLAPIVEGACSTRDQCGLFFNDPDSQLPVQNEGGVLVKIRDSAEALLNTVQKFMGVKERRSPEAKEDEIKMSKEESGESLKQEEIREQKQLTEKMEHLEQVVNEQQQTISEVVQERDTLKAQVKGLQDKENVRIDAQRQSLIKRITAKTGGKAEDYSEWGVDKLEKVHDLIVGDVDRSLKTPDFAPPGVDDKRLTVGRWDPSRKEWISE